MAVTIKPAERDLLVQTFRRLVYAHWNFTPFAHQADWQLASEGWVLTDAELAPDLGKFAVVPPGASTFRVLHPCASSHPRAMPAGNGNFMRYADRIIVPRQWRRETYDGTLGPIETGPAHYLVDMASFKAGKSKSAGMWTAGFAALPGGNIELIGLEYGTSENEFNYLVEALLSSPVIEHPDGSRERRPPLFKKKHVLHHYNDPRGGRMQLTLRVGSGAVDFLVRSWERKEALKGHQISLYLVNEAYQLPGLEVMTNNDQNLRAERGYWVATTTPDKPWVRYLHDLGHGQDPDWHCTCGHPAWVNPLTYLEDKLIRDCPDASLLDPYRQHYDFIPELQRKITYVRKTKRGLMTNERFAIAWLGRLGGFVGNVYKFKRGDLVCTPASHPQLFRKSAMASWARTAAVTELERNMEKIRAHA